MPEKIVSVLLVTKDESLAKDFRNQKESYNKFYIDTFVVANNREALLHFITLNSIDVLILDLKTENPYEDSLLDVINQVCKKSIIIGTGDPSSEFEYKAILEKKVKYFFAKPFKKQLLFDRINFLLKEENKEKYKLINEYEKNFNYDKKQKEISIIKFLYQTGAFPSMKGYEYIKDAIYYALDEKNEPHKNNKCLYKFLEKIHNQDSESIGKSMKRVVNLICKINKEKEKVSCLEFISKSALEIKLK